MNDTEPSLRDRALAMLSRSAEELQRLPTEEVPKLLHELQVHQMELDIQNEELRQAQIRLAQSHDRYVDLYEFAPVGYLTLDKKGVIRQANLKAAEMLQVSRKYLPGRKFSEFLSDQAQDAWHLHRRRVFAQSTAVVEEVKMRPQAGVSPFFGLHSLAFCDEQGNLSQCRTALTDVSDRRLALDALRQLNINLDASLADASQQLDRSIAQLRLLSEAVAHLGEGVMITEGDRNWPQPKILFVNQAMCRIAGCEEPHLIGQTPRVLQGAATSPAALEQMHRDLETQGDCLSELVNYRKDGTPYDVEIFITALCNADGKRTHFVSVQRDITHRKRVEEDLRRQHEFNASVVEKGQVLILVLDVEGRIVQFNPYLENITGWKFAEVQGQDWFAVFVAERDRAAAKQWFDSSLAGELPQGNVHPILTRGGQRRFVEWSASPLTNSQRQLTGLLYTGQDVTARRELERHLVEVASEERRRIGNDLHDGIGQELTGLSMVADSLAVTLRRASRPEAQTAEKIKTRLQIALAQVRTLSRGMNPVDIDAQGLMSALSEMAAELNELTGVQCTFQYEQPVLLRDNETATQLFRVAQEATANAIHHGHPHQITISIQRTEQQVTLRVADDGCGIDVADTESVGMGLRSMAYRAQMIQGELDVSRREGGGTQVVCTVPCRS